MHLPTIAIYNFIGRLGSVLLSELILYETVAALQADMDVKAQTFLTLIVSPSSGADALPNGLDVTFEVTEIKRLTGSYNTMVGNNEGSMVRAPDLTYYTSPMLSSV